MKTAPPEIRRSADPIPTRAQPAAVQPPPAHDLHADPHAHGRTPWWAWLLIVVVAVGLGLGLVWRIHAVRASAAAGGGRRGGATRDLPVVVATARKGDLPVYLYGLGVVTPLKTVDLLTRVDGAITEIHYTEGQHVKAGDFLLQIDPAPYQAVLDQAKGQLKKDRAAEAIADWNVKSDTEALKTKAIAEQQFQTDTAARDTAAGAIAVDQANIDAAQVNLDYCHVTSPIDGTIGLRLVDVGNIVHAAGTTSLVVITQEQPITVVFTLAEDELEQLQKRRQSGQPVRVDAYDRTLTHRLARGTLLALDSAIDPTTLTIKAKAQFDNADGALFPQQAVNARLLVDTIRDAVLIPSLAVQHNAAGDTFVYLAEGDDPKEKTVKMRTVTLGKALSAVGPDEADTTVVTDGLEPGDVVVTTGVDKLIDGMKVLPRTENETTGRRGATRPTTGPTPMDATGVGGPAMDRPEATGGATTRPFTAGMHAHKHKPQ